MAETLQIVRRGETPPRAWDSALFLTGPAEPTPGAVAWGEVALARLREKEYRGVAIIDEDVPGTETLSVAERARWADHWRERADCVLMWFPAASAEQAVLHLAGLGEWARSERVVVGVADGGVAEAAELRRWAAARRVPAATTLAAAVDHALELLPPPAWREGAERDVPLQIWRTSWFQGWYSALKASGNALLEVKEIWTFRRGRGHREVVLWALRPKIRIAAEGRTMSTEVVIGRPDMSALVLYLPASTIADTEVVLVRDFRPAGRGDDGYVWELPSGSGDAKDPQLVALFEFAQETGLIIDSERLDYHGAHQVWPTGAAHVIHLYSAEATEEEIAFIREQQQLGVAHGLHEEEEFTFPQVLTWREIRDSGYVDWATMGMVIKVLGGAR